MNRLAFFLSLLFLVSACSDKMTRVPEDQFVGTWRLEGRSMFSGMEVTITNQDGKLKGHLTKLNDNKYIQLFTEPDQLWVSGITRRSNYEFELTEKLIARELLGQYGLGSSKKFHVQFLTSDSLALAPEGGKPESASVHYVRVN